MDADLRNRITAYSFILTIFVIWLHAGECLITNIPGQIAVPGFFVLSGFLFFVGFDALGAGGAEGSGALLKQKLKRRVRSLLVPYLLWNLIYFLICLVLGEAQPDEAFQAIFFYSCNPVFWYLYQLILITVLTPVIYLLIRKKTVGILYLLIVFLLAVRYDLVHQALPWFPLNFDALFYYSFGAFASLHLAFDSLGTGSSASGDSLGTGTGASFCKNDAPVPVPNESPEYLRQRRRKQLFLSAVILFALFTLLIPRLSAAWVNLGIIGQRLCGALSLWFLLGLIPQVRMRPWMTINFFVYATHYLVIRAVWKAEIFLGLNESEALNVLVYLIMPALCIAAAYVVYLWMKKFTPRLLSALTGGRG